MRNIILISIVFLAFFHAEAQYPGYKPVSDITKFKTEFAANANKITSVKSDFIQEKNLSMLSEKIISKGKFWFKKENRVRMEYTTPFTYLMILNKDKVYIKDGQKENKISTKSNKLFQQINKLMIDCMQGTALSNADFKTNIFENNNSSLIEMVPVAKGMKAYFKSINIITDKKDFSVISIQMTELSGDNTLIRFSNKELNTAIENALFDIK